MPPSIISTEVQSAEASGIPVIGGNISDSSLNAPIGMKATVAFPYRELGQLVADSIIVKSKGHANVFVAYTNDTPETTVLVNNGMLAQFKAQCPSCTVHSASLGVANWATGLQSLTASSLTANPNVTYVIAEYDAMGGYMIPAMRSAANSSSLGLYTLNADLAQMQEMAAGGNFIKVDVGSSPAYEGWAFADEALRVLTGHKAVLESVPVRLFNTSNVKSLKLTQAGFLGNSWYGTVNFQAAFKALWTVK
jgi:ribose transport system substrate-binding protein